MGPRRISKRALANLAKTRRWLAKITAWGNQTRLPETLTSPRPQNLVSPHSVGGDAQLSSFFRSRRRILSLIVLVRMPYLVQPLTPLEFARVKSA